jgi:hypothetical protein
MESNSKKKQETVAKRQAEEKAKLIACFRQIPIIEIACRKSNLNRSTYYNWMENDPGFRGEAVIALSEGEEFISDKSESQLLALVGEKHFGAIKYWLTHHRPKYQKEGRESADRKIRIILIPDDTEK